MRKDRNNTAFTAQSAEKKLINKIKAKQNSTLKHNPGRYSFHSSRAGIDVIEFTNKVKCSYHNDKDAVLLLSTTRADDFLVPLCSDCLYALCRCINGIFCKNKYFVETEQSISIREDKSNNDYCMLCGANKYQSYVVRLNSVSFVLCGDCFKDFAYKIMSSNTVKLLFGDLYQEFLKVYIRSRRIKSRSGDEVHFEHLAEKLVTPNQKNFYTYGNKKDFATLYPLSSYKVTVTDFFDCTLMCDSGKKAQRYVFEADRAADDFCVSFCIKCIKRFLTALKSVDGNSRNYYDNSGLSIVYYPSFKNSSGGHCYFCGDDSEPCYEITLNKSRVFMCAHCKTQLIRQLETYMKINHNSNFNYQKG